LIFFSHLFHAAAQNVIPDTEEAFGDLQAHLARVGIKPDSTFKRIWMYPKKASDPDDRYENIYRLEFKF
jgi:hypothetical protein